MKMFLYTYKYARIKEEGYKSLALFDKSSNEYKEALMTHKTSAGSDKTEDIEKYLESTFEGRLRSICAISEIAPIDDYKHPYLNYLVHHADVISFDIERLIKDGIVEAIYCKDLRQTILTNPNFENIYRIDNIEAIDASPYDWDLCGKDEYIKYSPWSTIKHYFLVLTKGIIPPEYIKLEVNNSGVYQKKANFMPPDFQQ